MMRGEKNREAAGGRAARQGKGPLWYFLPENDGSFLSPGAENVSRLYFPLMNRHGMKCSVTPELKGDIASAFQNFLTVPVVTEDLHRSNFNRNFWVTVPGHAPWSATGNSVYQKTDQWTGKGDDSEIEGRIGAFISRRRNEDIGLESEITVFVPDTDDYVELMKVVIRNISGKKIVITPVSATPVFGRHADNLRDHRQVTTMFQKVFLEEHGVRIQPTIVHDEQGHSVNKTFYAVLGFEADGNAPEEIWASMYDFIGEGGSFDNPEAIFKNLPAPSRSERELNGREAIGAMRYRQKTLAPGEEAEYIILHGISEEEKDIGRWSENFGDVERVDRHLEKTLAYWQEVATAINFGTGNETFDHWAKWVSFQLKCRQIFGNSYLPDFGYGRGGRGWRDLWQDLLSIFLIDPENAREEIQNNFRGVRIDGSNATIIGTRPGEFKADRNNVPRTWSDHGAWPVFVLNFYIHQTGDLAILFEELPYWKDNFTHRSKGRDEEWKADQGYAQLTKRGEVYEASILEHILLQQLTAFYNVGEHNNLLLEGGDWNDTLDMARERGESVCFHNFYGHNLSVIADLLAGMRKEGHEAVELLKEAMILLDRLPGQERVDYDSPAAKRERLDRYFREVSHVVSGEKVKVNLTDLITDLKERSEHIASHIRNNEWLETAEGHAFFNGHYDNEGNPLHGDSKEGIRMDLTSQVMPVMCKVATEKQVMEIWRSSQKILKDEGSPGLRLCTEFKELDLNIGRITGFNYGYKEHGSKWSQQNIMFMYGLYSRGFVKEGHELFKDIFKLGTDSSTSLIFPGIPSFFEPSDRGSYAYLTGSSTWLILALTTQIFGVDGYFGDLLLKPRLVVSFFDEAGRAGLSRNFRDLRLDVHYLNPRALSWPDYRTGNITINGKSLKAHGEEPASLLIPYSTLSGNSPDGSCRLEVELIPK